MATKIKKNKMKEADQMLDQNMTQAPAQPATQDDLAAAPAQPIDMPAVDPQAEPVAEAPATDEGLPIEVDPATVSLEVKVPTDQLAAAVSQSTGDVVPAETTPDAMATQESDLVASTVDNSVVPPAGTDEAPVDDQQAAPVMESQETDSEDKMKESHGECEASEAATKHDEDKLEQIIDTGVKNEGIGAMDNGNTSDGENKLDLIKDGVNNMKEGIEDLDDDDDDEDKIKDAGVVDATPDVPGLAEGDGIDDIDNMFDEPDSDEYIDKIENFLGDKEEVEDVADALRTTASFLDQIAKEEGDTPLNFGDLVNNIGIEDEGPSKEDEALGLDGDADVDGLDFGKSEGIDIEDEDEDDSLLDDDLLEDDDDDDEMFESTQRGPANVTARRQTQAPVVDRVNPLNESSIIYPVGSEPAGSVNDDYDMVRRQERLSQARREAIRNYRRTVLEESDRNQSKSKFNEALRSSAKSIKESTENEIEEGSWESNNFMSKFGESRLNYKDLLKNHFLG